MNELIGKTVIGLSVNEDQCLLAFDHPDGSRTTYLAYGDFDSETWFSDITGVNALLGGTVLEVENVVIPVGEDGRTRMKNDVFYGVKLRTDKGWVDIVYRNSSMGFYGGNIRLCGDGSHNPLTPITDDWSA